MSALAEIQDRIQSTNELIAQYERAIMEYRDKAPPSLSANIRALEKLCRTLEREFVEIAREQELEVFRYRLLASGEPPSLGVIGDTWMKFQNLIGEIYERLTKPEERPEKKGKEAKSILELGYAYTFVGSVGVVATLPGERKLFDESQVERTSNVLFDLIEAKDVHGIAHDLGPAPVRALHNWLGSHIDRHLGVGLEWVQGNQTRRRIEVQYQNLAQLQGIIADTTMENNLVVIGDLRSVNMEEKSFIIKGTDGKKFQGTFEDAITEEHVASIPARYRAMILETTKVIVLGAEPKTSLMLLDLQPLRDGSDE